MIRSILRSGHRYLYDTFGIRLEVHPKRPAWTADKSRYAYQQQHVDFDVSPGDRVLDMGSGGNPFPYATVLADRSLEMSSTRHEPLITNGKPFVLADIHHLPFEDKTFDYVYCVHVLELIEDPLQACREIMRVGKRGFIETPTAAKDTLFAWARGEQIWQVVGIGRTLCFFEYSERQLDGIRSSVWRDLVFSRRFNPVQEMFYTNQDVFNVMFKWTDQFSVFVFRLDGTIETLNLDDQPSTCPLVLAEQTIA